MCHFPARSRRSDLGWLDHQPFFQMSSQSPSFLFVFVGTFPTGVSNEHTEFQLVVELCTILCDMSEHEPYIGLPDGRQSHPKGTQKSNFPHLWQWLKPARETSEFNKTRLSPVWELATATFGELATPGASGCPFWCLLGPFLGLSRLLFLDHLIIHHSAFPFSCFNGV